MLLPGPTDSFRISGYPNRSIPTCVGFTRSQEYPSASRTVHPHVRGVYLGIPVGTGGNVGPSPRAWGLRTTSLLCSATMRSIPTCVGFTLGAPASLFLVSGPSPRAWGLQKIMEQSGLSERSIPTCVGFTAVGRPVGRRSTGPSPRAWGLRND